MKVVRRHPRFNSKCPVVIERDHSGLLEDGFCLDVSEGGLRVVGPSTLEVDDDVSLRIDVDGHEVVVRARVRWTLKLEDGTRVSAGLELAAEHAGQNAYQGLVEELGKGERPRVTA